MKYITFLFVMLQVLLNINVQAQKKWSMGIGVQTFGSTLHDIGKVEQTAYNSNNEPEFTYLAPHIQQTAVLSYGAHIFFDRQLGTKNYIDFGLGYSKTKNDLSVDYTPDRREIESPFSVVNISRNSFYIPVNFNYIIPIANNVRVISSLGILTNYMFYANDNYLSTAEIGYSKQKQYTRLNIFGKTKTGIVYGREDQPNIGISIFANYGINAISPNTFKVLIYDNLSQSSELQFGLELNYIFSH